MNLLKTLYVAGIFVCMQNASAESLQDRLSGRAAELTELRNDVLAGTESLSNPGCAHCAIESCRGIR